VPPARCTTPTLIEVFVTRRIGAIYDDELAAADGE
jgi:hypothetical protein